MTKEEKALELKREYSRNYRKKHPEKNRQYQRDYWLRRAEKALNAETKK